MSANRENISYGSYLKLPELLNLQELLTPHKDPDEMIFIIIHQAYELWFKLVIHETGELLKKIKEEEIFEACKTLNRLQSIYKILLSQVDTLHTLSPDEFNRYRVLLEPASGFQSYQYRIIEYAMGLKETKYLEVFKDNAEVYEVMNHYLQSKSVWEECLELFAKRGLAIPDAHRKRDVSQTYEANGEVTKSLRPIYLARAKYPDLHFLCESLIDVDSSSQLWRLRHLQHVARTIGDKHGTGGSTGVPYLKTTIPRRFFPELWDVRSLI